MVALVDEGKLSNGLARQVGGVLALVKVSLMKRRTKNEPRLNSLVVTVGDDWLNTQI